MVLEERCAVWNGKQGDIELFGCIVHDSFHVYAYGAGAFVYKLL
jgi:hypothetical protein